MTICVVGLWHLGTVTAACLASAGHDVVGLDFDPDTVTRLRGGRAPLFEPGLDDLLAAGLAAGRLRFTGEAAEAVRDAELVWVAFDTPVDEDDRADVEFVVERTARLFPHLRDGALVLVSSQVPVGTVGRMERAFDVCASGRRVSFACSPENLRLGNAVAAFTSPGRVVVGLRSAADRQSLAALFAPFTERIEWMSVESAEMTKHAVNAFLATSVAFINELASLCEQVGADAAEVERGLKSEPRIGPGAYLSPGGAFAGGTLARDVVFLSQMGQSYGLPASLFNGVKASNDAHRQWAGRRLAHVLGDVRDVAVAVWGLTYKPGTDTLRRSASLELCRWLVERGAMVRAHDPAVTALPAEFAAIRLADPLSAVTGASALVVSTPWPVYQEVDASAVASSMARGVVLDANGFLRATLGAHSGLEYYTVGKARV